MHDCTYCMKTEHMLRFSVNFCCHLSSTSLSHSLSSSSSSLLIKRKRNRGLKEANRCVLVISCWERYHMFLSSLRLFYSLCVLSCFLFPVALRRISESISIAILLPKTAIYQYIVVVDEQHDQWRWNDPRVQSILCVLHSPVGSLLAIWVWDRILALCVVDVVRVYSRHHLRVLYHRGRVI